MTEIPYVHGYSSRECDRLADQAATLSELLHHDTVYPPESLVLECGCGTGAQTVLLASRNPAARIVCVDVSAASLDQARTRVEAAGFRNIEFHQADIFGLPFPDEHFDHVFLCFVLEHVAAPAAALRATKRVLGRQGTITVIEGDHGSWYCYPQTPEASRVVQCLVDVQARLGGDSLIGRRLYPLLMEAGFSPVRVSPRMVYVDSSRPDLVDGFSKKTFIAMVEGVRDQALSLGLIDLETWEKGIEDLYRATQFDGTFCYTFFKAIGGR
ncbi:MAG TPA: methyltransferase domain-containing protein [Candidatus Acidoferrales bacterium]|nr:methyltransferase domain-containing protein [Candidatus Acidoferrales bacterium]